MRCKAAIWVSGVRKPTVSITFWSSSVQVGTLASIASASLIHLGLVLDGVEFGWGTNRSTSPPFGGWTGLAGEISPDADFGARRGVGGDPEGGGKANCEHANADTWFVARVGCVGLFNIACDGTFVVEDGTCPNVEQTVLHVHFWRWLVKWRHEPFEVGDVFLVCSIEHAKPDHDWSWRMAEDSMIKDPEESWDGVSGTKNERKTA
jgi:hypothetical protein